MYNLSESEFAVEESNVGGLVVSSWVWEVSVAFRKGFSELSGKGFSGFKSFNVVFLDILKIEVIDNKSGWDDVILVNNFDEWLDSSSFNEFFLVNASLD